MRLINVVTTIFLCLPSMVIFSQIDSNEVSLPEEITIELADTSLTENHLISNFDAYFVQSNTTSQDEDSTDIEILPYIGIKFSIKDSSQFNQIQIEVAIQLGNDIKIIHSEYIKFSELNISVTDPNSYEIIIQSTLPSDTYTVSIQSMNNQGATHRVLTKNISI